MKTHLPPLDVVYFCHVCYAAAICVDFILSKNSSHFCINYLLLRVRIRNGARSYPITQVITGAGKCEKKIKCKVILEFHFMTEFCQITFTCYTILKRNRFIDFENLSEPKSHFDISRSSKPVKCLTPAEVIWRQLCSGCLIHLKTLDFNGARFYTLLKVRELDWQVA